MELDIKIALMLNDERYLLTHKIPELPPAERAEKLEDVYDRVKESLLVTTANYINTQEVTK